MMTAVSQHTRNGSFHIDAMQDGSVQLVVMYSAGGGPEIGIKYEGLSPEEAERLANALKSVAAAARAGEFVPGLDQ